METSVIQGGGKEYTPIQLGQIRFYIILIQVVGAKHVADVDQLLHIKAVFLFSFGYFSTKL